MAEWVVAYLYLQVSSGWVGLDFLQNVLYGCAAEFAAGAVLLQTIERAFGEKKNEAAESKDVCWKVPESKQFDVFCGVAVTVESDLGDGLASGTGGDEDAAVGQITV